MSVPLHKLVLQSDLIQGEVEVSVCSCLPVEGVQVILGNDLAGEWVWWNDSPHLVVTSSPMAFKSDGDENSLNALPSCVITRSMRKTQADDKLESKVVSKTIEIPSVLSVTGWFDKRAKRWLYSCWVVWSNGPLWHSCQSFFWVLPGGRVVGLKVGPTWRVCNRWSRCNTTVSPSTCVTDRTWYVWPYGGEKDIQVIPEMFLLAKIEAWHVKVHLNPVILVQLLESQINLWNPLLFIPFQSLVNCLSILLWTVGPLPQSKAGNEYLLTIMCQVTRYPAAYPLHSVTAKLVVKALTQFICVWNTKNYPVWSGE